MESKQRIVVGADVAGRIGTGSGTVEHFTDGDPIDITQVHAEADDPPAPLVHDDKHPVGLERQGFTSKQIDAP